MNIRSKLATAAAVGAATVGGAALANAATSGTSTAPASTTGAPSTAQRAPATRDPSRSFHTRNGKSEKPLTGSIKAKVQAAALKKVPGTVERVETNVDSSAPYEAHIRKANGTSVEVQVNKDFTVAAVNQMGGMGGQHP